MEISSSVKRAILSDGEDWSLRNFLILLTLGIIGALYLSHTIIGFNAAPETGAAVTVALSLSLFLLITVFQTLLLRSFTLYLWVCVGEAAGFLFFYFGQMNAWMIFGAVLFVFSMVRTFYRGRRDLEDHMKIQFRRFAELVLTVIATGLAVFLAFLYAGLYHDNGLSLPAFRFISGGATPVLARFVPEYSPDMGINTFFYQFAKGQLEGNRQVQALAENERTLIYRESSRRLEDSIIASSGVNPDANESVTDYFYRISVRYLDPSDNPQLSLLAIILIILITYSTVRFALFFLKWLVALCSVPIYRLLLKTKVIYITNEPRNQEIILVK